MAERKVRPPDQSPYVPRASLNVEEAVEILAESKVEYERRGDFDLEHRFFQAVGLSAIMFRDDTPTAWSSGEAQSFLRQAAGILGQDIEAGYVFGPRFTDEKLIVNEDMRTLLGEMNIRVLSLSDITQLRFDGDRLLLRIKREMKKRGLHNLLQFFSGYPVRVEELDKEEQRDRRKTWKNEIVMDMYTMVRPTGSTLLTHAESLLEERGLPTYAAPFLSIDTEDSHIDHRAIGLASYDVLGKDFAFLRQLRLDLVATLPGHSLSKAEGYQDITRVGEIVALAQYFVDREYLPYFATAVVVGLSRDDSKTPIIKAWEDMVSNPIFSNNPQNRVKWMPYYYLSSPQRQYFAEVLTFIDGLDDSGSVIDQYKERILRPIIETFHLLRDKGRVWLVTQIGKKMDQTEVWWGPAFMDLLAGYSVDMLAAYLIPYHQRKMMAGFAEEMEVDKEPQGYRAHQSTANIWTLYDVAKSLSLQKQEEKK